MDTDGEPGCLDYIWVRGAVRVTEARLAFDRPHPDDPTLYPSDHLGIVRPARGRLDDAPARPSRRLAAARPRTRIAALAGRARGARLRRRRVRRPPLGRRRPGAPPRRDARARPGAAGPGSTRSAPATSRTSASRRLADVLLAIPHRAFLERRAQGAARPDRRRGPGRRPRSGPGQRRRLVVRAGDAGARRRARPGLAALAERLGPVEPTTIAARGRARVPGDLGRVARDRSRRPSRGRAPPASRSRPGPSGAGRRTVGWQRLGVVAACVEARRARRLSASSTSGTEESRMTDRADLVVVGAGTVGGWASVFAAEDGVGRVVVARARAGRDGRLVAGGRHRPGPGRHAGDGRARSLVDRLLPRPGGAPTAPTPASASSAT